MPSLCTVDQPVTVNNVKILSVAQKFIYGKLTSLATTILLRCSCKVVNFLYNFKRN
jgi:hypothetical protein